MNAAFDAFSEIMEEGIGEAIKRDPSLLDTFRKQLDACTGGGKGAFNFWHLIASPAHAGDFCTLEYNGRTTQISKEVASQCVDFLEFPAIPDFDSFTSEIPPTPEEERGRTAAIQLVRFMAADPVAASKIVGLIGTGAVESALLLTGHDPDAVLAAMENYLQDGNKAAFRKSFAEARKNDLATMGRFGAAMARFAFDLTPPGDVYALGAAVEEGDGAEATLAGIGFIPLAGDIAKRLGRSVDEVETVFRSADPKAKRELLEAFEKAGGAKLPKRQARMLDHQERVRNLFDPKHSENTITIGGKTVRSDPTNKGGAKIFKGVTDKEIKHYFEEITGQKLPEPRRIEVTDEITGELQSGIRYTVETPHGNFNLRDVSASWLKDETKPRWTIDVPRKLTGRGKSGVDEIKFP